MIESQIKNSQIIVRFVLCKIKEGVRRGVILFSLKNKTSFASAKINRFRISYTTVGYVILHDFILFHKINNNHSYFGIFLKNCLVAYWLKNNIFKSRVYP